jgi:hypothetical protein
MVHEKIHVVVKNKVKDLPTIIWTANILVKDFPVDIFTTMEIFLELKSRHHVAIINLKFSHS